MRVLVLDNYDSFTYNLVQYIQEILGYKVDVIRNDQMTLDEVEQYDVVVLSPGPGVPGPGLKTTTSYCSTSSKVI